MHGDYASDVGHDGMKWSIVTSSTKNIGAGHWFEWREDGSYGRTIGFANAQLTRVGRCRITIDEAACSRFRSTSAPAGRWNRPFGQPAARARDPQAVSTRAGDPSLPHPQGRLAGSIHLRFDCNL